ncbi:MAG: hypothetical protein ACPG4U_00775 [Pseudomonadales bacterium]
MRLGEIGVVIWGFSTAILGFFIVFVVVTGLPANIYTRVKEAATALGAVVAASALAWSLFYQQHTGKGDEQQLKDITQKLEVIEDKVNKLNR